MSLRNWISISGAAISPARGHKTNLGNALLYGLANLRTGYWWDSSIAQSSRSGYPILTIVRRLLYLIPRLILTQSLILSEWVARLPGPWARYWYLSDGGYFENLAGYELIRRHVPRIIICDAGADPKYQFEDLGELTRLVRIDFDAYIEIIDPAEHPELNIPEEIQKLLARKLDDLKPRCSDRLSDGEGDRFAEPSPRHAALFRVRYGTSGKSSILLYLKASLTGDEATDVENYHTEHLEFPHESTVDQIFDESQWESYRKLGEHIASPLFQKDWFWDIPLGKLEKLETPVDISGLRVGSASEKEEKDQKKKARREPKDEN